MRRTDSQADGGRRATRRAFLGASLAAAAGGPALFAQGIRSTEKTIDPIVLPLDKPGVWTLHFRYREPRIVTVEMPNVGRKQIWYMWYQVYNRTGDPQLFIPEFELVTKDLNTTHLDEPHPVVVDAIRKIEDPTGVLDMQTSISISKRQIPITKPDSVPRAVSGVAIWTDMGERAPRTNRMSVYVLGLSNGLATTETAAGDLMVLRKALQINFVRPTDDTRSDITDIRRDESAGTPAETWVYRSSNRRKPLVNPLAGPMGDGR